MLVLAMLFAAVQNPFRIEDATIGAGPSALSTKALRNQRTGELLQVVTGSGGKTARLRLRSPTSGVLREVLVPLTNATAIRETAEGIHYAGSILAPFANRVANGTYTFFGQTHFLERNECPKSVRCDALHGFLFNRSLDVVEAESYIEPSGAVGARLTLGYDFDGLSTPGWPFRASVNVTYVLESAATSREQPTMLRITIRAVNTDTGGMALPWTTSWHPYFAVSDVSATRIRFDTCGGGAWRHLRVGPGGPRGGDLIPTGKTSAWTRFDGKTPLGGTLARPTYFDDGVQRGSLGCIYA